MCLHHTYKKKLYMMRFSKMPTRRCFDIDLLFLLKLCETSVARNSGNAFSCDHVKPHCPRWG